MASLDYEGKFTKMKTLIDSLRIYRILLSEDEVAMFDNLDKLKLSKYKESPNFPDHFYKELSSASERVIPLIVKSNEHLSDDELNKKFMKLKSQIGALKSKKYINSKKEEVEISKLLTNPELDIWELLKTLDLSKYKQHPHVYDHYFNLIDNTIKDIISFQKQKDRFNSMNTSYVGLLDMLADLPQYREKIIELRKKFSLGGSNRGDVNKQIKALNNQSIIQTLDEINGAISNLIKSEQTKASDQVSQGIIGIASAAASVPSRNVIPSSTMKMQLGKPRPRPSDDEKESKRKYLKYKAKYLHLKSLMI
jgi:hypothetical protein